MNDASLVRRLEGLGDLGGDFQSLIERNRPACDARRERLPRNELEDEIVGVVRLLEAVDRGSSSNQFRTR